MRAAFEQAFDYRGDVTLTLQRRRAKSKATSSTAAAPADARRVLRAPHPQGPRRKNRHPLRRHRPLEFTGRDTAAGKSLETWVRKYREKKAAGEKNIGLEPEKLE